MSDILFRNLCFVKYVGIIARCKCVCGDQMWALGVSTGAPLAPVIKPLQAPVVCSKHGDGRCPRFILQVFFNMIKTVGVSAEILRLAILRSGVNVSHYN